MILIMQEKLLIDIEFFSSNYYERLKRKKKHNARVLQLSMGKAQKTLVLNGFVQIFLTYTINKKALIVLSYSSLLDKQLIYENILVKRVNLIYILISYLDVLQYFRDGLSPQTGSTRLKLRLYINAPAQFLPISAQLESKPTQPSSSSSQIEPLLDGRRF